MAYSFATHDPNSTPLVAVEIQQSDLVLRNLFSIALLLKYGILFRGSLAANAIGLHFST